METLFETNPKEAKKTRKKKKKEIVLEECGKCCGKVEKLIGPVRNGEYVCMSCFLVLVAK